ncbi:zf-DHHC-domain-containing protein [Lentinula aff. lateritia]|uniref:Zf-DHHC-domain-containing protein n=1 Tax=Lentinula aff. lateritia TaxID=2804960 RepID=A0ACC1TYT4_9AGAR|nr:zf-DHHC-domain-containing protein [Lentinula aff. lateritia]
MPEICRVIEEAKFTAREQRAAKNKPQPWIVLKLMVLITTGIMGYAGYVYIGRFCVEIIKGRRNGASKGTGIALLAVFCLLLLWMLWAYAMVVFTAPGFARDHVPQCPPPVPPPPIRPSYVHPPTNGVHDQDDRSFRGHPYEQMYLVNDAHDPHNAGVTDAFPRLDTLPEVPLPASNYFGLSVNDARAYNDLQRAASKRVTRRPPTTPVLAPEYRYCSRCLLLKPYRAHHCRLCGTCVLKYDHHCPWIGQCVGARNQKYFVNFNLATAIFTAYTLSTFIVYTVRSSNNNEDLDPQQILITALSGLFFIFTITLFLSHIRMLALSLTTVESLRQQSMKDREDHMLADVFGFWEVRSKRRVKAEWDKEWGQIDREGNMWWAGGNLQGWEETMGSAKRTKENPWGWLSWILPFRLNRRNYAETGMNYQLNPRFDKEGRWRRRSEWPEDLR